MSRQCRECGATPCKGNGVYCRECYNAHTRARYARAVAGESELPKLCKCGRYYRTLGVHWCAACCREYHMHNKRRMTNVLPERQRGHLAHESRKGKLFCEGCARYLTPEHYSDVSTPRCQLCQRADEYHKQHPPITPNEANKLANLKRVYNLKLRKFKAIYEGIGND